MTTAMTRPQATELGEPPVYITLAEAGARVRKSARWVERHLSLNVNAGAPAVIVFPSIGRSGRAAAKLVSSQEWSIWLSSFAVTRPVSGSGRPSRPAIPVDLLPPSQRKRFERGS